MNPCMAIKKILFKIVYLVFLSKAKFMPGVFGSYFHEKRGKKRSIHNNLDSPTFFAYIAIIRNFI